jgi:hypothetical protein
MKLVLVREMLLRTKKKKVNISLDEIEVDETNSLA